MHLSRIISLFAVVALLLIAAPATSAQQGGNAGVGIIGGVQPGEFPLAVRVKVTPPTGPQFWIPLNGIRNYLAYYAPDGSGSDEFATGGFYQFEYQTTSGHAPRGNGGPIFNGTASYSPMFNFSQGGTIVSENGVLQRPNISPNPNVPQGALGIQSTVRSGNSNGPAVAYARVELLSCNSSYASCTRVNEVRTNGAGFFSFYYTTGLNKGFVSDGYYKVRVTKGGFYEETALKRYQPFDSDPSSPDFYVLGAQGTPQGGLVGVNGTIVLQQSGGTICTTDWLAGSPSGSKAQGAVSNGLPYCPLELPAYLDSPDGGVSAAAKTAGEEGLALAQPLSVELGVSPNPMRGRGTVQFTLSTDADVRLELYDAVGRRVESLAVGPYTAGSHDVALSTSSLSPGVYVARLSAGSEVTTSTLTVVR